MASHERRDGERDQRGADGGRHVAGGDERDGHPVAPPLGGEGLPAWNHSNLSGAAGVHVPRAWIGARMRREPGLLTDRSR